MTALAAFTYCLNLVQQNLVRSRNLSFDKRTDISFMAIKQDVRLTTEYALQTGDGGVFKIEMKFTIQTEQKISKFPHFFFKFWETVGT